MTLLNHRVGTERRRRAALAGSAQRPLQIPGLPELTEFGAHRGFDPSERTMLHQALGSGSDLGRGDRIADKPANETRANLGRTPRWQGFEQATLNHVGQGSGSYTTRDFEELLRYAQARHIEVIPEFDFPAHARAGRSGSRPGRAVPSRPGCRRGRRRAHGRYGARVDGAVGAPRGGTAMIRGYRLSVGRLRSPAAVQQGEWRVKSLGGRAALVLVSALVTLLVATAVAAAATPIPRVVGPLAVSASSHPFGGAAWQLQPQNLAAHGYVEEEYLVSGKANVYAWAADNKAVVRTADAPYTTRMIVRRPVNPARLSGTVVVEPLNPSNRFDLNIGWAMSGDQFMRNGDVWVGFTSKPVAVQALKTFDAPRYGSLSWANPLPLDDPRNCENIVTLVDPVAFRSRMTEDGLVWDIFSQIGAWLKSDAASNPLAGGRGVRRASRVDREYGFGYSQTGSMMITYINAIQPRVVADEGKSIYDGYFVGTAGGNFIGAAPLNQCTAVPRSLTDPRRSLRNAGVPVIQMMSQSDYLLGIDSRQPDGDTPPDLYRHYEMAGAAHATPDELLYSARPEDIVAAGRDVPPMSCDDGPRSRFPSRIFIDAALQNIDLWSRYGLPAPPGRDISLQNGQPVLDQFGNVQGGLRSPYLDVPTSTWFASSKGLSFCFIAGHEVPFHQATLDELYPTHGTYVHAVAQDTHQLVGQRYITRPDGQELLREAAHSDIPGKDHSPRG